MRSPASAWRSFLALPNERPVKTLGMAFLVSIGCAVFVSASTALLAPRQAYNRVLERNSRVMEMLREVPGMKSVLRDAGVGDLETSSVRVGEEDHTTYVIRDGERLGLLVLPISGKGYQSTLRGYLTLRGDLNTVAALTFYEQGETPGLGARIAEKDWLRQWPGKRIYDAEGQVAIHLAESADGPYQVDAITGATGTSDGVSELLAQWMGPKGFGPFIQTLKDSAEQSHGD